MDRLDSFLDILQDLMTRNGLNATTLAAQVGYDRTTIKDCYRNKHFPRTTILIAIAHYFHCSMDYLLGFHEEQNAFTSSQPEFFIARYDRLRTNKYTDYEIAKLLGIENSTISKWRKNGSLPHIATLIRLKEILNCSLDYLLGIRDFI